MHLTKLNFDLLNCRVQTEDFPKIFLPENNQQLLELNHEHFLKQQQNSHQYVLVNYAQKRFLLVSEEFIVIKDFLVGFLED